MPWHLYKVKKMVIIMNRYNFYSTQDTTHAYFEEKSCKFYSNTALTRSLCVTVEMLAYYQQYKNDGGKTIDNRAS